MTASAAGSVHADVAVIGGSGLYTFADEAVPVELSTPFGEPSAPVMVADVGGRSVAFLPRHGRHHEFPPHRVPARANLWALRALGVRQVIAPYAVGSLVAEVGPGRLVVPDQLLDRTSGRPATYYDDGAVHVGFADPYCPVGRLVAVGALRANGEDVVDGGVMAVINGPRFSTRAESRALAAAGATVVNMTAMPEAALARELAMCLTPIALVTDHDAGADVGDGVTHTEVLDVFAENLARLKQALVPVLAALPAERSCPCAHALDGIRLPFDLP